MKANKPAGFRKWIPIGLALLFCTALAVWFASPSRQEPVYQRKPLSVWLEGYQLGKPQPEIDQAVRAMGSNALPTLLRMLQTKDSPVRDRLARLANRQSLIKLDFTTAEMLRMRALAGFRALAGEAKNALPDLVKNYTNSPGAGPFGPGAALAEVGPDTDEAIRSLLLNAQNTNTGVREIAVRGIANINSQSEVVVPALIKAVHDRSPAVQFEAFQGLGRYGEKAKAAVPDLFLILTNDVRLDNRARAALALRQIVGPKDVVPILMDWLRDTNQDYRAAGALTIGQFGKDAQPAVPCLTQMLADQDIWIRHVATGAIQSIDPEAAAKADAK